jgi:hypothetical protein
VSPDSLTACPELPTWFDAGRIEYRSRLDLEPERRAGYRGSGSAPNELARCRVNLQAATPRVSDIKIAMKKQALIATAQSLLAHSL